MLLRVDDDLGSLRYDSHGDRRVHCNGCRGVLARVRLSSGRNRDVRWIGNLAGSRIQASRTDRAASFAGAAGSTDAPSHACILAAGDCSRELRLLSGCNLCCRWRNRNNNIGSNRNDGGTGTRGVRLRGSGHRYAGGRGLRRRRSVQSVLRYCSAGRARTSDSAHTPGDRRVVGSGDLRAELLGLSNKNSGRGRRDRNDYRRACAYIDRSCTRCRWIGKRNSRDSDDIRTRDVFGSRIQSGRSDLAARQTGTSRSRQTPRHHLISGSHDGRRKLLLGARSNVDRRRAYADRHRWNECHGRAPGLGRVGSCSGGDGYGWRGRHSRGRGVESLGRDGSASGARTSCAPDGPRHRGIARAGDGCAKLLLLPNDKLNAGWRYRNDNRRRQRDCS